ncbi:MAG TPA: hypothetical protein VGS20_00660 [Candidatus Acidoferrales bacterium]|nr:hypothetical protein [Candidatus Acidoferrales bacterium]
MNIPGREASAIIRKGRSALAAFFATAVVAVALGAAPLAARQVSPRVLSSKLQWRSVGPYIGGRVAAVAGVSSEPNLFYMGTTGGGIWESADYGIQWKNLSDGKLASSSGSIGAIAVAPSNPKILYAGSGECDIRNTTIPGDGMYKSTDGGDSWRYAGLRDTHTICAIAIDPRNADVVYAASMGHVFKANPDRGVFKSSDGGQTWQKVLSVNHETGAIDIVMDPSHPDTLYAAMWQAQRTPWGLSSGGPGSGIYKTTDGGSHWSNLTRNAGLPAGILGRIGVSVSAANPSVIYAIIQAKGGGVFRSADGGGSWTRVNAEWKLRQRAFYYMSVFADPKDAGTLYAPEVDALWVSHDGGKTFQRLRTPHGDNHIVWINPNDTSILLEGNDGGATVSTDAGKTWSSEHNQPTGQFYHVALDDQFPYHIYGAQQDEGSFEGPSASPGGSIPLADWHRVAYGESTWVAPQPGSPNITYGSGYYSILMRYDLTTGQYQDISPWPNYQEGASSAELKYRFGWTHPVLFSPVNPKELLVGAQYVLRSDDYGQTWQRISPDLTRNDPGTEVPSGGPIDLDQSGAEIYPLISALAVSPRDGRVIWAGSDDGLVHVTADGGQTWQDVRPPELPEWSWVSSIQPSYAAAGAAYLTARRYMWDDFHPYVFETADFGKHWTAITAGLPEDSYVFGIRQDPNDSDLLLLGTSSTVYASFDAGAHWQPLTLNLPTVQVRDIAINPRQGQVAIATHGRAFWVLDDLAALEQMTRNPSVDSDATFLFAPEQAWLTHAYGQPEEGFKPADAGDNPPSGATILFHIPASYDGETPVTLTFSNAQGQVIRAFSLHLAKKQAKAPPAENPAEAARRREEQLTGIEPGMNRFQWDLRYPSATEVEGFQPPVPAGGLPDTAEGPVTVPGAYSVALDYGGRKTQQNFNIALDPRLDASQQALEARLALGLKIHQTLDTLDSTLNRAIAVRDKLRGAVASRHLNQSQAGPALAALDAQIGDLVQLGILSSEGSLLHETKLRSHLAYLAADIDLAFTSPTAQQVAVFEQLDGEAKAGEQKLDAAIAEANKMP